MTEAPGLFVRVGIESFEGVLSFVERDLPRAFRDLEDMHLLGDLADASTDAIDALRSYIGHLRDELAPRSRASFRLGPERFGEKLRLDEGIDLPAERLAQIALRELQATQEEFRRLAGGRKGDPADVWQKNQGSASRRGRADPDRRGPGARPARLPAPQADRHGPGARRRRGGGRPPTSTAGRSRACGRRGRSRPPPCRRATT